MVKLLVKMVYTISKDDLGIFKDSVHYKLRWFRHL